MRMVGLGFRLPPPPGCPRPIYEAMMQCWYVNIVKQLDYYMFNVCGRHPEADGRPTFTDLVSSLSLPDEKLLMLVSNNEETATVLGGPIETGYQLYIDIQNTY